MVLLRVLHLLLVLTFHIDKKKPFPSKPRHEQATSTLLGRFCFHTYYMWMGRSGVSVTLRDVAGCFCFTGELWCLQQAGEAYFGPSKFL